MGELLNDAVEVYLIGGTGLRDFDGTFGAYNDEMPALLTNAAEAISMPRGQPGGRMDSRAGTRLYNMVVSFAVVCAGYRALAQTGRKGCRAVGRLAVDPTGRFV